MTETITDNITLTRKDDHFVIKMKGEADMDFVNAFSRTAQEVEGHPEHKTLVLDMEEMSYIDSASLSVLIRLIKIYGNDKNHILVYKPQPPIVDLFSYTNLEDLVTICDGKDKLEAALSGTPLKKRPRPAGKAGKGKKRRKKKN
jgi:anti-anti-sigma factor